jgi:hypothetical protein
MLGKTQFPLRDAVHPLGAQRLQTALDERKKGATRAPVSFARLGARTPAVTATARDVCTALWAWSASAATITIAALAAKSLSPSIFCSDCKAMTARPRPRSAPAWPACRPTLPRPPTRS